MTSLRIPLSEQTTSMLLDFLAVLLLASQREWKLTASSRILHCHIRRAGASSHGTPVAHRALARL